MVIGFAAVVIYSHLSIVGTDLVKSLDQKFALLTPFVLNTFAICSVFGISLLYTIAADIRANAMLIKQCYGFRACVLTFQQRVENGNESL